MTWNWQQPDWPDFRFDDGALRLSEATFLRQGGMSVGAVRHLAESDRQELTIELLSSEAVKTSEIEGEILDRQSVQSSLRKQFGLAADSRRIPPSERGVAEMMVDLYRTFDTLFRWHAMLVQGRGDLTDVGRYRTDREPMQVVSGAIHVPKVHFEAPPSQRVPAEMAAFNAWFKTGAGPARPMATLARAGIAHLYFVSIHPFEDGNGRIARAISEKVLAQGLGRPSLTALSVTIERRRRAYYDALERANKTNEVTDWLIWFADTVLEAQRQTQRWIDFLIAKARLLERLRGRTNERQNRVLLRMMREGPEGFKGGLSTGNYISIAGSSPATARRDLSELVRLGALVRTGERKGTRYWVPFAGGVPEGREADRR
jgi:Fic family protein